MEFLIILIVISFLIGTISFALPSKSSREISELRMNASRMGFKFHLQILVKIHLKIKMLI